MQVLVKNWLVGAEKTEVAHLWAAVNVWLKYRSCLVGLNGRVLIFCCYHLAVSKQNSGCDVTQW